MEHNTDSTPVCALPEELQARLDKLDVVLSLVYRDWPTTTGVNMRQVNSHDAKTRLSKLIEQVSPGEEVIIAKARRDSGGAVDGDYASHARASIWRDAGASAGGCPVFEPLPETELRSWE